VILTASGGIYRTSVRWSGVFLLLWVVPVILTLLVQNGGGSTWFGSVWLGGHIPLFYLRYLSGVFFLWMLADLFFIRRAPPAYRKAQWATTIFMLLLYSTVAALLESLVAALEHVARA
jgi:hypothetical protein